MTSKKNKVSVIKHPLLFVGSKGEKSLYTLFDSGANLSCINPEYVEGLEISVALGRTRLISTAAEGHFIEVTERVSLDFYLNDVLLSDEFLLVPGLSEEAIIGAATMQKWRIKLNFEYDTVEVDPKVAKMQLKKAIAPAIL
ncbi:retropepsin-like aspartic protease [Ferruginibacter sp.]